MCKSLARCLSLNWLACHFSFSHLCLQILKGNTLLSDYRTSGLSKHWIVLIKQLVHIMREDMSQTDRASTFYTRAAHLQPDVANHQVDLFLSSLVLVPKSAVSFPTTITVSVLLKLKTFLNFMGLHHLWIIPFVNVRPPADHCTAYVSSVDPNISTEFLA